MVFNSFEYLFFLPVVFCLYWFLLGKKNHWQNILIILASYLFYGLWDYRFLSLIFLSTVVDYFVGQKIHENQSNKIVAKRWLWVTLFFNLGLLGTFKYFNFFIDSFEQLTGYFGYHEKQSWTINIILPIGISFYTFQTLSYSLDIYYKRLEPTKNFVAFMAFVSFFPQLVAGPIERASNLLGQITAKRFLIKIKLLAGSN